MTKPELLETQREAIEICRNATADLRIHAISLWQWLEVTRHALLDFWGAVAEYNDKQTALGNTSHYEPFSE